MYPNPNLARSSLDGDSDTNTAYATAQLSSLPNSASTLNSQYNAVEYVLK